MLLQCPVLNHCPMLDWSNINQNKLHVDVKDVELQIKSRCNFFYSLIRNQSIPSTTAAAAGVELNCSGINDDDDDDDDDDDSAIKP